MSSTVVVFVAAAAGCWQYHSVMGANVVGAAFGDAAGDTPVDVVGDIVGSVCAVVRRRRAGCFRSFGYACAVVRRHCVVCFWRAVGSNVVGAAFSAMRSKMQSGMRSAALLEMYSEL